MVNQPHEFRLSASLAALAAIERDLSQLLTGLKEDQFHASSLSGGWSVAYCIEHLVLTGAAFLQKWDYALSEATGKRPQSCGPFRYRWWQRMVLRSFEPPYRIKTRTQWAFTPCSRQSIEETVRHFSSMHREIGHRIERSVDVDARQARVQSPFFSWISYPLGLSFDLALAHERRHVWQAWQVRRQFPVGNGESIGTMAKPASVDREMRYTVDTTSYRNVKR